MLAIGSALQMGVLMVVTPVSNKIGEWVTAGSGMLLLSLGAALVSKMNSKLYHLNSRHYHPVSTQI